jgi:hypothetical protein
MFLPRELVSVLPNSAHLYNQTHISTWLHPGSETLDAFARRLHGHPEVNEPAWQLLHTRVAGVAENLPATQLEQLVEV